MAWDEWEHLKAEAAEQHDAATRMQLNQYPADGGGGGGGAAPGGKGDELRVSHESLNGNANSLIELAGLLYEGRPDGDLCTTARAPRSHPDVAAKVDRFARFADDQYQDVTSLLAALSTRLRDANGTFVTYDGEVAGGMMNAILELGVYVAPEDR
ncbi:hypothetical protein [Streptomyces antibioticus]|uniref:hypothetical protein n=1 Tax=Streptomyces antibioticus TaxID=1890 RepID=UPI001FD832F3|nr:hypothetical protein [Streptomyces antibioticus]MCX5166578.1 hypothetical protein [Streptomyces antibioticus]